MKPRKTLLRVFAVALLVVIGAVWALARSADDSNPPGSSRLVSGLIGIVPGQIARVNVVNWGDGAVSMEATLLDGDGKSLLKCNGVIAPGKSISDEFQWPCCGDGGGVRGLVTYQSKGGQKVVLVATLEIVDAQTGKTTAILPYIEPSDNR